MTHFVGLDVSVKETSVCRRRCRQGAVRAEGAGFLPLAFKKLTIKAWDQTVRPLRTRWIVTMSGRRNRFS